MRELLGSLQYEICLCTGGWVLGLSITQFATDNETYDEKLQVGMLPRSGSAVEFLLKRPSFQAVLRAQDSVLNWVDP